MTDETPIEPTAVDPAVDGQATVEHAALAAESLNASEPLRVPPPSSSAGIADERPELLVGAAFAGGLALALLLKRLAR
jgi:hypothetical protein